MKKIIFYILLIVSISSFAATESQTNVFAATDCPKREFRGAWIQCVNGQFLGMSTQTMQADLTYQLDELQKDGINVIIFQVRPECDALYYSNYEPWSRFLTGRQGEAPQPYWDPLQWMIDECHKRGMELHAWINPYRAKTKTTNDLSSLHIASTNPERVFEYDGLWILNPGIPENRQYICDIVKDIVERYDVDGLHIDDYFYPYPVSGINIPDHPQFNTYGHRFHNIRDWRRENVNMLIKELNDVIHSTKPWVKFGVSPFGIYRNKKEYADGSLTNGLTNYDGLYADVLCWLENGWIDYNVPQIYWQIGHDAADYKELINWWNDHAGNRLLIIGEDVERTVKFADTENPSNNQQYAKMALERALPNVSGSCMWYSRAVVDNVGQYGTQLRNVYFRRPALQPLMPWINEKSPDAPSKLKPIWTEDGYLLFWTAPKCKAKDGEEWRVQPVRYAVYRFAKGEKIDVSDTSHLVAITSDTFIKLPYNNGKTKYTYIVTALNRTCNESAIAKKKVKL